MENFSRKERRVIEKYEAGSGFREIHNGLGVGQAEAMRIIGRYRRARRAEEESICRHCEWRINGNMFCVLPKCFLKSAPGCGKMVDTI